MSLPFAPPLEPMLSKPVDDLPAGDEWIFEPKWDGFRTLVFRDGDDVYLQSRDQKPMARYFPELLGPIREQTPERCILDGEVVIAGPHGLDFETLQMRIHPAASRVKMLAETTPASFVAWDLLAEGDEDLRGSAFGERRARLEKALAAARPPLHVSPVTRNRATARDWFERFEGAGLDGVMAKDVRDVYAPGGRQMLKIKHERTADVAVAGFRWHKNGPGTLIGSLLLGLYDDEGRLQHVGITSSFTAARRRELVAELAPLRDNALEGHPWAEWKDLEGMQRVPGVQSRWSHGKNLTWEPLRVERACEVAYDHMQGTRFRHPAVFRRWRLDKAPTDCRYDQLDVTPPAELEKIFRRA
ncbi:MAG TPA: ATP-dependent DNA ligase [Haliangiales bacterium]|nr:ATP-dependent DNA ligase [Haliangiales bacterium]